LRTRYFETNLASVTDEEHKAFEQAWEKFPRPRTWLLPSLPPGLPGTVLFRRIIPPELLEFYKKIQPLVERVDEDYAVKIDNLRDIDDAVAGKVRRWRNAVLAVMPSTNYARMASLFAETGDDNLIRFMGRVRTYWQSYVRYLNEKNAYGLKFLYPYPEEFTPQEKSLIERINKDYFSGKRQIGVYRGKYLEEALAVNPEIHYLDLSDLPAFSFHAQSITEKAGAALPNILILIFYNLVSFLLAHFSFNHYDPRKDA
jgi:hypothetical protein